MKSGVNSRRPLSYLYITALLAVGYLIIARVPTWRGQGEFFQILQTSAALLSLVVGIIALLRYSAKKNNTLLFLATGFIGAAAFDLVQIVFTSDLAIGTLPSAPESLYAWGWTISRLFVSLMMFFSCLSWWAEKRWRRQGQVSESVVYIVTTILLLSSLMLFGFVSLPQSYFPELFISRPWELISALLFTFTLVGYLAKGEWRFEDFDHWVILMLVVSAFSQILLATVSYDIFDSVFYGAYLAKNLSLWLMLTGLLMSVSSLFHRVAKSEDILTTKNVSLTEVKVNLQESLQVTRLKEAELAKKISELQRERAKDAALLDSIGDGLVATDDDTRIVMVNRGFEAMLGYSQGEVHGQPVTAIIQVEDESGDLVPYEKRSHPVALFTGKKVSENLKHYYRRKDGSRFPVSVTVTPMEVEGQTIGAVEVFRDITREKNIDRSKTEFVSLASHQLRTPLTSINWYTEMILGGDSGKINKATREYVEEISLGTSRMSTLVSALLNVSRIDMGTLAIEPSPTDIQALADEVLSEFESTIAEKKLDIKRIYKLKDPLVEVDPNLMRIIYQNLISNAVKYTAENGTVTISIQDNEDHVTFEISDTGYGIPSHQQGRIFQKLFRADNVRALETDGTGLGLFLVKSILDEAGGSIWFESTIDVGSKFLVKLPVAGMKSKRGTHNFVDGQS